MDFRVWYVSLLVGILVGIVFARFTSDAWGKKPVHVWGAGTELAYTCVAICLLIWTGMDWKGAVYPVSGMVAACGTYHFLIGIAKR